ncbi:MAG TPA: hypothetical protein VMZ26_13400 [Pyrinomonadaceae bacterium]|nr:hypothetical protein [Pyrinomonadaceae bacterium]
MKIRAAYEVLAFAGVITAATVFLFLHFESKADALERRIALDLRLERIEKKIDKLLGIPSN